MFKASAIGPDTFAATPFLISGDKNVQRNVINDHFTDKPAVELGTEKHMITVDMRQQRGGQVYLGQADVRPDVLVKMKAETFDALCDKRMSGFRAFATGQLKMDGKLGALKEFDNEVVN